MVNLSNQVVTASIPKVVIPASWFWGFTGTKLLNHVLDLCSKQNIPEIYLHVQTNNEDAIAFYKKFGFEITDTIQNYYTNITPPDCYVLTKFIAQAHPKKWLCNIRFLEKFISVNCSVLHRLHTNRLSLEWRSIFACQVEMFWDKILLLIFCHESMDCMATVQISIQLGKFKV